MVFPARPGLFNAGVPLLDIWIELMSNSRAALKARAAPLFRQVVAKERENVLAED
jgi:hypothetical protein